MIQFFPDFRTFVSFQIGDATFTIAWYALCILGGALLGYFIAQKLHSINEPLLPQVVKP